MMKALRRWSRGVPREVRLTSARRAKTLGAIRFTAGIVVKESGYLWWIERLRHALSTVDILTARPFPAALKNIGQSRRAKPPRSTAVGRKGPGADFFEQVKRAFDGGDLPIIRD